MKTGTRAALLAATAAGAGIAAAAWSGARPRLMAWGATWDEVVRPLPGDDLVANPLYVTTRATTVDAPLAAVWPWVVQLGQDRGGFYTYDWLENLFRLDIHSTDEIRPEWQDPRAGVDSISLDPDGVMRMTFAVVHPGRAFVLRSGAPGEPPQESGDFFKGEIEITWAFVLESADAGRTRLLTRTRAAWADTTTARLARGLLLSPAHLIMERGMLRGIKKRAERRRAG
jgi:hypothetical protein